MPIHFLVFLEGILYPHISLLKQKEILCILVKVGFKAKISRDIFVPFNPILIWGLKWWKYKYNNLYYIHTKGIDKILWWG